MAKNLTSGAGDVEISNPRIIKGVFALDPSCQPQSRPTATVDDSSFIPSPQKEERRAPKPVSRIRAFSACNHCRLRRRRCENDNSRIPCHTCVKHGEEIGCYFYAKGERNHDREFRNPRQRGSSLANFRSSMRSRRSTLWSKDPWADLPPLEEMIDGVQQFLRYFQPGFIPRARYLQTLRTDHRSLNLFLLLSILSASARLSPPLKARYGDQFRATRFFMDRTMRIAEREVHAEPLLERCQAYLVLSMTQQANGLMKDSDVNLGIAIRMARDMELHLGSSYQIKDPTPERIIRAESACRTLWMLHDQDKRHSSAMSVEILPASDITALLPGDEVDFAAGREPRFRAALSLTASGAEHPELVCHPKSSLFASLMEAYQFWDLCVQRGYDSYARGTGSLRFDSGELEVMQRLGEWERSLPPQNTFSRATLQQQKAIGQDLAYLSFTMIVRLCNIVLSLSYLEDIIDLDKNDPAEHPFYNSISNQLFTNIRDLFVQIEAHFTDRTPEETFGAQIIGFSVYVCALCSTYLNKHPHICPDQNVSKSAPYMLKRTRGILVDGQEPWPMASCWLDSVDRLLQIPQAATPILEWGMAYGKDPKPDVLSQQPFEVARQSTSFQIQYLPLLTPEDPMPPESRDITSSTSSSIYTFNTPGHQLRPETRYPCTSPPDQSQMSQSTATAHPGTYVGQPLASTDPSLLQAHHQLSLQDSWWYLRPSQSSDELSLLIDVSQQEHTMLLDYEVVDTSELGFVRESFPKTNGLDDQLRTFTGSHVGNA